MYYVNEDNKISKLTNSVTQCDLHQGFIPDYGVLPVVFSFFSDYKVSDIIAYDSCPENMAEKFAFICQLSML